MRTILALAIISSCTTLVHAIDGSGSITSQGVERQFLYHAPGDSVAEGLPVVLVFHNVGSSAQQMKDGSGFDAVADAHGFMAVYPQATNIGGQAQWNAYVDEVAGHGGIGDPDATDDVIFFDDLIGHLCTIYGIDPLRIHATGFSNGGFMAYRLAVHRPQVVASVAPVAADLWGDIVDMTNYFSQQYAPVGVMHVHGDADATVPYPDPTHDPFAYVWPLGSFAYGNCEAFSYEVIEVVEGVDRLVWCDHTGTGTQGVELVRLHGLGHEWPAIPGFDLPMEIWNFMNAHEKDAAGLNCSMTDIAEISGRPPIIVYPNPTTGVLWFHGPPGPDSLVRIYDMRGSQLKEMTTFMGMLDATGLPAGPYVLEVIDRQGNTQRTVFSME